MPPCLLFFPFNFILLSSEEEKRRKCKGKSRLPISGAPTEGGVDVCSAIGKDLVKSLTDFAAGLDEDLRLCPVRCLRVYLQLTAPGVNCPQRLFVSPWNPSGSISKNASV